MRKKEKELLRQQMELLAALADLVVGFFVLW